MSRFPLRIGPTGRYLVTQSGEPFLIHGEAAWSLAGALNREEATQYMEDRSSRGVNTIIVNLVERLVAPDAPRNAYGVEPFTTTGDLGTPNPAYFEHVDWLLGRAAELGILVLAVPCYLGYPDPGKSPFNPEAKSEGWYDEVLASGVAACEAYGQFLGERYADADNVVWMMGGDRNPGKALEHMRAVVRGIRRGGARQLFTAHVLPEHMVTEVFPDDDWLEVTTTYTYGMIHQQVLRNYNRVPTRPTFLVESTYENEHNASELQIRRQAWWALLSGACGQCVGSYPVDVFQYGWESALDSPAIRSMGHLKHLVESYRWWELVPDARHEVLVAGIGEFRGGDTCCAAATPDRRLVVAYMPSPREITLDLCGEGPLRVTWLEPATGQTHDGGLLPAERAVMAPPPQDHDWVVIFESGAD
jgi:Protein of unknown function (DUF4038)